MDIVAHVAQRTKASAKPVLAEELSDAVEQGIRHVLNNFSYDISVNAMAEAVGLSKFYFIRKFRRETDMTPGVFLQRFRIVQAMNHLINTDYPIGEIARQVGYRNPAAFSRVFMKITGTQPRLFRQAQEG